MAFVYRVLFPRVIKRCLADEVLFKTYVTSTKTFDFGPLQAGREPELCVTDSRTTIVMFGIVPQMQPSFTFQTVSSVFETLYLNI